MDNFGKDGITQEEFFRAAKMSPNMIVHDMDVMSDRVDNITTKHFAKDGLERVPYVRAALKNMPQVLSLKDSAVIDRLEAPLAAFGDKGLERSPFMRMTLKAIRIAATDQERTMAGMNMLLAMTDMGVISPSKRQLKKAGGDAHRCVFNYLEGAPTKMGFSIDNFVLRTDWAMRGPESYSGFGIMQLGKADLLACWKDNFGEDFSMEAVAQNNEMLYSTLKYRNLWLESAPKATI
jgi:hypothetical protein